MSKILLGFSDPAEVEWVSIFNSVESAIQPGGLFCQARDYASKVAENIARLAGVLHAFEGYEGTEISVETLKSAAGIVLWYTAEYVRLFSPPSPQEVITGYAVILDEWLIGYVKSTGQLVINRNDLLQLGPNKLRCRSILDIAIQRLIETNRVACVVGNAWLDGRYSRKGTQRLTLNPHYYERIARGEQPWGIFYPL